MIGQDPATAAARLADAFETVSAERLLDTPFVLLARNPAHGADIIAERHERYGFQGLTTQEPYLEALGQVIAAHRK